MTQLEKDIKLLREKYGDLKSIKVAEAIMRVVEFAEKSLPNQTKRTTKPFTAKDDWYN